MRTKLTDYPKNIQAAIRREARRSGLTVEKVLANADALSSGQNAVYRARESGK